MTQRKSWNVAKLETASLQLCRQQAVACIFHSAFLKRQCFLEATEGLHQVFQGQKLLQKSTNSSKETHSVYSVKHISDHCLVLKPSSRTNLASAVNSTTLQRRWITARLPLGIVLDPHQHTSPAQDLSERLPCGPNQKHMRDHITNLPGQRAEAQHLGILPLLLNLPVRTQLDSINCLSFPTTSSQELLSIQLFAVPFHGKSTFSGICTWCSKETFPQLPSQPQARKYFGK